MIGPDRSAEELRADIERARAARARLRGRPLRPTVDALAAAAEAWVDDPELHAGLPDEVSLFPAMIDAVLPLVAEALDYGGMAELVECELGSGALDRPAPDGPALIGHVLASNVPALAVPAIALGCLTGATVIVKSGRHDRLSAPAFRRALAVVEPELADTIVTAYWPGGSPAYEEVALATADVVVLTGGDEALGALIRRVPGRVIAHGPRVSVAAVGRNAVASEGIADAIALDVALYEQRGCLSPQVVYVETGGASAPRELAGQIAAALERVAKRFPPTGTVEERAAARVLRDTAEWTAGAEVFTGSVVYEDRPAFQLGPGGRRVRVYPVATLADVPALLPAGRVECVGLAGADPEALAAALRERGVSRCCPLGRMQRPRLSWPRGQQAPIGALLGWPSSPDIQVEQ